MCRRVRASARELCLNALQFRYWLSVDMGKVGVYPSCDEGMWGCGDVVPASSPLPISELLAHWNEGDREAVKTLVPLLYGELRRVAHNHLRKARRGHTLQTTALVHEAYLRLEHYQRAYFQNRPHFIVICALSMRQILTGHERNRRADKRDKSREHLSLDDAGALASGRSVDLLALDDALRELARLDPQQSRIVELRFFGGLSVEETSAVLGLSPATVKRRWASARIWLHHQLKANDV